MVKCPSCIAKAYCTGRKSFVITDQFVKTAKLFHRERFAMYHDHKNAKLGASVKYKCPKKL